MCNIIEITILLQNLEKSLSCRGARPCAPTGWNKALFKKCKSIGDYILFLEGSVGGALFFYFKLLAGKYISETLGQKVTGDSYDIRG